MTAPAGWYPDPDDPNTQRYFDGSTWTDETMPGTPAGPPVPPPPPPPPGMPVGMPPAAPATTSNMLSIIAMVCGGVALLFCPILLGPAGIVLGVIAKRRGESLATIAIAVAAVGMVLGFAIGAMFAASA